MRCLFENIRTELTGLGGRNSPPPPPRGQNAKTKVSRGFAKSFSPENSFGKTESAFRPATLPRNFLGRTPKRKMSFPFLEKIHPRENQKCKEHFFFSGLPSEARQWRGDCPSVRFSFKPPRAPCLRRGFGRQARVECQSGFCWK